MKLIISALLTIVFMNKSTLCDVQPASIDPSLLVQSKNLGDCQACKVFTESFKRGLERTARGKYEGGDAAWEEEKLKKSYKRSEMRLVDIQENLCKESKYAVYCHNIAEKAEEYIELWWSQDPDETVDLFSYICIEKMKLCCPKNHYGKLCLPCAGGQEVLCSGNGKCRGDGTRKGNGTCLCDAGYTGENCERCAEEYYLSYEDEKKILCSPCHKACLGECRHGGPKDCVACKPGYTFDADEGCTDVNECNEPNKCRKDEFCVNSLGSYACLACDKSCNGCNGDGPDLCRKCAAGYSKKGEFCIQDREEEDPSDQLTTSRYMTYVGLLIATGILLPKSTPLGSFVGLLVLTYIIGAEYYCMINDHTGIINIKEFDLKDLFKT